MRCELRKKKTAGGEEVTMRPMVKNEEDQLWAGFWRDVGQLTGMK